MAIYYGDGSNSSAGRLIQTVQYNYTAAYSAGSGLQSILTGAYIQPKVASSKILVTMSIGRISGPSDSVAARVLRDRGGTDITAIGVHTGSGNWTPVSWQNYGKGPINDDHADGHTWQWLDTHGEGVGQNCYYTLQLWGQDAGTIYVNRTQNSNNSNQAYSARTGSAIILQEIAA